jgi:prolyl-tRNA synthetase
MSKMYINTLREVPSEASIPSHILLLRAGMIKKVVSGVYGYMPFGYRSLRKIENIVREEMDMAGGNEVHMSAICPAELWKESGRWDAYGPELWRIKDRNAREFCLGPTHEEVFTDLVRNSISSYRQLPINLYQIQTKYRDEARPRFGLMRGREFLMKDSYSFDVDEANLDVSYKNMYKTYTKIFDRCGLYYKVVEADSGAIGGNNSHEFSALSDVGESELVYCNKCNMAATAERAVFKDDDLDNTEMLSTFEVSTPDMKTIEQVCDYLNVAYNKTIKALLFQKFDSDFKKDGLVVAFVRGDREVNITKLVNALDLPEFALEFANEEDILNAGFVPGFTGPVGINDCICVVDSELTNMKNLVAGANKKDYHLKNVNYDRDYTGDIVCDIKLLKEGDPCPVCGEPVKVARGIEVGQVFKLGTKYSSSMGALYKDEAGKDKPIYMGCYGIGVSRTLAAIVEQHHDEDGIVWPMAIAPYHVIITQVNMKDKEQTKVAEDLYNDLSSKGIEVILDDRDERAGVKFKDADLIGIPIRVTVGKLVTDGKVEFKLRSQDDKEEVSIKDVYELIKKEM